MTPKAAATTAQAAAGRAAAPNLANTRPAAPKLAQALAGAERAARSAGRASRAHAALCQLLAADGRRLEAAEQLRATATLPPGAAEDHEALGFAAFGLGEYGISRDFYARVVGAIPHDSTAWYNLATGERSLGDLKAADAASARAIALDPRRFPAYLFRSQLFTQSSSDNHIAALQQALQAYRGEVPAQVFLNYALGKELDDLGRYNEAFTHFARGARARRAGMQYDVRQDVAKLARIVEVFDEQTLKRTARSGASGRYGFILGLPRSGTTLVERILTGHPNVQSNGETENFSAALLRAVPDGPGDIFERASLADLDQVAAGYAQAADASGEAGLVLEKLPLNYLYAGLIHMALPKSKIVLVRRGALDNCFAMFSTVFGSAYPFSYDLGELAEYYAAYDSLVRHWKSRLTDQVLEIGYEALVDQPAERAPPIAKHVGLDWRPDMVKVENNAAPSATESAVQIRRPIYRSAAGRWRNYADQLRPLIDALDARGLQLEP